MFVVKRDGRQEKVSFDKITARISKLAYGLNREFCDPLLVAQKVVSWDGIGKEECGPFFTLLLFFLVV